MNAKLDVRTTIIPQLRALISQGFYLFRARRGQRTAEVLLGGVGSTRKCQCGGGRKGGGKECVGRYYYIVTCSTLRTTRQIFRTLYTFNRGVTIWVVAKVYIVAINTVPDTPPLKALWFQKSC